MLDDSEATALELTLAEVQRFGTQSTGPRSDPFGLIFLGPPQPILAQRIHSLRHAVLGVVELFLVPIGPAPDGRQRYEAIFN